MTVEETKYQNNNYCFHGLAPRKEQSKHDCLANDLDLAV